MKLSERLTRKNVVIASSVLLVGLVVAGFFFLRRSPRVAMERYVPADALAFIEVDSLADLVEGLTGTMAWRELAPVLGLSSQLRQVALVTDLIGRTGLGPDEAVVAGRAQFAIAITALESKASQKDEGASLQLTPHFALIIETKMKPAVAARLARERAPLFAERIYGPSVVQESENYGGSEVLIFRRPDTGRQILASSLGSVLLIANQPDAMTSCLDAVAGRAASLADDLTLKQMRSEVDPQAAVFAYVTERGATSLLGLWPALVAGRSADPESIGTFTDLVEQLSQQAGASLLYSSRFERGGVSEKYLTVLRPQIAEALAQPLKASGAGFASLALVPSQIESVRLLNVDRPGELPERVLKHLSPVVDVVAGVALREFVISFRKQYGLEPTDRVGDAVGSEIAIVDFGDDQPRAMLIRVNDRAQVEVGVMKYLRHKGASVTNEQRDGTELLVASGSDRRAAAFVGDFLVLGTTDQILRVAETQRSAGGLANDDRLRTVLSSRPASASTLFYSPGVEAAGSLMLAISKVIRVTDGSPELLERDEARRALDRLPRSISFTEFRTDGVLTQAHSAVGSFGVLTSLIRGDDQDL